MQDHSSRDQSTIAFPEALRPSRDMWLRVRKSILAIEHAAFKEKSYSEAELAKDFSDPKSCVVVLKASDTKKIVGYAYAIPDEDDSDALYVNSVALLDAYQGKGLVGPLLLLLEDSARANGYHFITTDAAISNGYADATEKHYGKRVVESNEHESFWGSQRYMKIRL